MRSLSANSSNQVEKASSRSSIGHCNGVEGVHNAEESR
jgi:hypothetical protein